MHRTQSTAVSISPLPLQALDAAFLALARASRPLTLPAAAFSDEPIDRLVPVDEVRARLIHPSCAPAVRQRIWTAAVRRARQGSQEWTTAAAGLAVPALRKTLGRLPRLPHLEQEEVEQEMLAALLDELVQVDPADPMLARRLIQAADKAGHRLVYRARTAPQHDHEMPDETAATVPGPYEACGTEYDVLVRAAEAQIISWMDAHVIARTRLVGVSLRQVAKEWGIGRRELFRRRAAAESRLGEVLGRRAR